jgi:hypothetical protein
VQHGRLLVAQDRQGREPPKERPELRKHAKGKPRPSDQENFTDPDSRIMKASTGFEQCYNAQIAVDGEHRLIVAAGITNSAAAVGREGKEPRSSAPQHECTARMRRKLATKRGRRRYGQRKHIAEPPFGWIKQALGFHSFSLRGLSKVAGEWNLVCLATNLRRTVRWRPQHAF